jgi:hypothetical protein
VAINELQPSVLLSLFALLVELEVVLFSGRMNSSFRQFSEVRDAWLTMVLGKLDRSSRADFVNARE